MPFSIIYCPFAAFCPAFYKPRAAGQHILHNAAALRRPHGSTFNYLCLCRFRQGFGNNSIPETSSLFADEQSDGKLAMPAGDIYGIIDIVNRIVRIPIIMAEKLKPEIRSMRPQIDSTVPDPCIYVVCARLSAYGLFSSYKMDTVIRLRVLGICIRLAEAEEQVIFCAGKGYICQAALIIQPLPARFAAQAEIPGILLMLPVKPVQGTVHFFFSRGKGPCRKLPAFQFSRKDAGDSLIVT